MYGLNGWLFAAIRLTAFPEAQMYSHEKRRKKWHFLYICFITFSTRVLKTQIWIGNPDLDLVKAWASKELRLKTFDLPPTKNSKELLEFYQAVAYLNHIELTLTLPHLLPEINILNLNSEAREKDCLKGDCVTR